MRQLLILYKKLFFLFILSISFSQCKESTLHCKDSIADRKLSFNLKDINLILKGISHKYFLSSLRTLTYYKGYYYNINKTEKKFYQFKIVNNNRDTSELVLLNQFLLDYQPEDFCFNSDDLYIISESHFSKLFKYGGVFVEHNFNKINLTTSSKTLILDTAYIRPNSRLNIFKDRYLILSSLSNCGNNIYSNTYFTVYDLVEKKEVSNFSNVPEMMPKNYFPSMDVPYRLDKDSLSLVSFGFDNSIKIIDNKSGREINEICAKSKFINSVKGIDISDDDFQKSFNYLIQTAYYLKLMYDPNANLFYRIVKHGQELKNIKTKKLNKIHGAKWSMIVFDNNLKYIDEIEFPSKIMSYLDCINDVNGTSFLSIEHRNNTDSILHLKKLEIN